MALGLLHGHSEGWGECRRPGRALFGSEASQWAPALAPTIVACVVDFMPGLHGDHSRFVAAAASGSLRQVRAELELGVDVNAPQLSYDVGGVTGATALHWAVSGCHTATVATLLAAGADPNCKASGMSGASPLHIAAQSAGKSPLLVLLLLPLLLLLLCSWL